MPENTVPAMLHAIDLGVTTLEMDVVVTKDGSLVLSHEPWMNADITTKPDGEPVSSSEATSLNIYKITYDEVKKYDVGLRGNHRFAQQKKIPVYKPLLNEVIEKVESYCTQRGNTISYNIETKCSPEGDNIYHPLPKKFIDLILPILNKHNIKARTIIQSFDNRSLRYLHKVDPEIKTALLIEDFDKLSTLDHIKNLGFTPTIYSPHYSLVNQQLVSDCHTRNMKVIPWTVNDLQSMKRLKLYGVDGLISDYPNLFKEL
jgi:glycerophosphoryl diester phosphodiesterase